MLSNADEASRAILLDGREINGMTCRLLGCYDRRA